MRAKVLVKGRTKLCGKACYYYNSYGSHCFTWIENILIFEGCPCHTCLVRAICNERTIKYNTMCDDLHWFLFCNRRRQKELSIAGRLFELKE